jgi:hypothetical protein
MHLSRKSDASAGKSGNAGKHLPKFSSEIADSSSDSTLIRSVILSASAVETYVMFSPVSETGVFNFQP